MNKSTSCFATKSGSNIRISGLAMRQFNFRRSVSVEVVGKKLYIRPGYDMCLSPRSSDASSSSLCFVNLGKELHAEYGYHYPITVSKDLMIVDFENPIKVQKKVRA